ncbi:RNA polymerase sigma factor [Cyclobacterium salsum]|uniref:RNA polymerase sigma factor n=1 Tax=Cyclobacterium salsum TaxID=2666329 RepID=UPI00139197CF|nr:sigma-70 family RNA polymerase sigma factor [Cyclobacterium salsum]
MSANNLRREEELIDGCLKGNRKSQRQLYEHYSGSFLSICMRYVKNRELAQDVLVEGFMKIFESLSQFKGEGSFEGWMKRVIVTQALLTLRKNKKLAMEVNLDEPDQGFSIAPDLNTLEVEDLLQLVAALPVGYRTVFNLYAIEGYSHREICEMLDISENTSKSQLSRARAILQQKITTNQIKTVKRNGR